MSADNGIYILRCKDQFRVIHAQAIDGVYWSHIDGTHDRLVPSRVVEFWGDSKYTRDEYVALKIAHKWCGSLSVCEYGVNIITYNKTWKHIVEDAKDYALLELEHINSNFSSLGYLPVIKILNDIINGKYDPIKKTDRGSLVADSTCQ